MEVGPWIIHKGTGIKGYFNIINPSYTLTKIKGKGLFEVIDMLFVALNKLAQENLQK